MSQSQHFDLLLIDDDDLVADSLELSLPQHWKLSHSTGLTSEHLKCFYHAAFVDMHLSDSSHPEGVEVIRQLRKAHPHLEIVAISGDLDRSMMEACLQAGASRFLAKPLGPEENQSVLEKIEALWLLRDVNLTQPGLKWVGQSDPSKAIQRRIANLAGESGPILIEGESGSGKEVVATLIHNQDRRGPLVTVNVAAIPEDLFESEFFGSVKGAFTGADRLRIGLAEAADGGDLFLDEVEALPLSVQAKLLRFLESGEVRRVGSQESFNVSVRVIAATNQSLSQLVSEGLFREDLLWRLSGQKVFTPPLRQRKEDISLLLRHFFNNQRPKRNKTFSDDAIQCLTQYDWPGNVRELKRACEQLASQSPLPIIRKEDVEQILAIGALRSSDDALPSIPQLEMGLMDLMMNYEKRIISAALTEYADVEEAAQLLKISRSSLYKKMKDHQIEHKR